MKNKFQTIFEKQLTLSALFFGFTFAAGPIEIFIADPIYRYALKFAPELYNTSSVLFKNATAAYIMIFATIIAIVYSKITQKITKKGLKAIKIQAGIECAHFTICLMYFVSIIPPLALIWLLISIYGLFLACTRYNYSTDKLKIKKSNKNFIKESPTVKIKTENKTIKKEIKEIEEKEANFIKTMLIFIGMFLLIDTIPQIFVSKVKDFFF